MASVMVNERKSVAMGDLVFLVGVFGSSIEVSAVPEQPFPEQMNVVDRGILFVAEGCGLGRIPVMPGTFGSLWGIPLGWALGQGVSMWGRLGIGLIMFLIGVPLCDRAARLRGSKDPGSVVWDEIAAFPLVYAFVPINWQTLIAGFVLFRAFDISKPPPVRAVEQLGGGLGIMVDDTVAAIYAIGVLIALVHGTNLI